MSFRSFLEHRLHLEDAIGAGAVDRLGVRDVEHLCEHEQDDVQRRHERSKRLHDVEHFADEDRELDLRALWKMMTPIGNNWRGLLALSYSALRELREASKRSRGS